MVASVTILGGQSNLKTQNLKIANFAQKILTPLCEICLRSRLLRGTFCARPFILDTHVSIRSSELVVEMVLIT